MHLRYLKLLAALTVLVPALSLSAERAASVQTAKVKMQDMTETITVFGEFVAVRQSDVATRVGGVISQVPIQKGSVVSEGQVLVQMDTVRLKIELASAEAQLEIANAGLKVAEAQADRADKEYQRARELSSNQSISVAELEQRESTLAEVLGGQSQAMARVAAAENSIDLARYNLTNATIRAPFNGVVLEVASQAGQFAASGSRVATLLDIDSMEVEANVPSRFIQALQPDRLVQAKNDAGDNVTLTLRAIVPTEFAKTRTRPVRFSLSEIKPSFAVGQPLTLQIPISETENVLTVPKDALIQGRDGWMAYVNDNGKASPRTVTIGSSIGNSFEVLSGLAPDDEVVVRGNERLRPGQDIAPMGAKPASSPVANASTEAVSSTDDESTSE